MTTKPRGKSFKHIPKKTLNTTNPLKIFYEAFIRVSEREYAQIIAKRTKKFCGYDLKVRRVAE